MSTSGGRRRESSRHRSAPRYAPSEGVARTLGALAPVLSLLPAVVLLVVVQALSPAAQRVPTSAARFDLATAWASTAPGALLGSASWFPLPPLGPLQLGLLLHLLQGGAAQSVLAAAHGAVLLLAVLQAGLLWTVLRRIGASGLAAGLATAVFGVVPVAVEAHTEPSASAVAVVWLLLACVLALGRGGAASSLAAGAAAAGAVASSPAAVLPVAVLAVLLVRSGRDAARRRATARSGPRPVPVAIGFLVVVLLVVLAGAVFAAAAPTPATRVLDAVAAARGGTPTTGAAALTRWAGTDPVSLVAGLIAVVLAATVARSRAVAVIAALVAASAVWPLGADAVVPLVLLLPAVAAAIGLAVDRAVVALGDPVFVRSVVGSSWLTGVAAVLLVALVVWLGGLTALVPGRGQPVAQVERWLRTGVPAGQTVLVGLGAWPDLERSTGATVGWYAGQPGSAGAPSSVAWTRTDYVVADPSLDPPRTTAAQAAMGRSLRVARYGSGDTEMQVRAVRPAATPRPTVTAPTTDAARAATAFRERVGGQLARNPRLLLSGAGRAQLLAGEVDARVVLVLAQFATRHSVSVSSFGSAPGDSSGIRTSVLVRSVDGQDVPLDAKRTGDLLRFLSELRGPLATRSIDADDDGVTAAFAPDPEFVPGA